MVPELNMRILNKIYEGELNSDIIVEGFRMMHDFLMERNELLDLNPPVYILTMNYETKKGFLIRQHRYSNYQYTCELDFLAKNFKIKVFESDLINDGCVEITAEFMLLQLRIRPKGDGWWKIKQ